MSERVKSYRDLRVYQNAMDAAMEIFQITKNFPLEEKYSLVSQILKSSRSVCANFAEAWRKRRHKAAFIAKLSDAETEACETQVWLEFSYRCEYIDQTTFNRLDQKYEQILGQIILMIDRPNKWLLRVK